MTLENGTSSIGNTWCLMQPREEAERTKARTRSGEGAPRSQGRKPGEVERFALCGPILETGRRLFQPELQLRPQLSQPPEGDLIWLLVQECLGVPKCRYSKES